MAASRPTHRWTARRRPRGTSQPRFGTYIRQVERDNVAPPSEATIRRLATDLREDPDVLLALAGKVSADLQEVIRRRPALFAELLRSLRTAPTHAVLRVVREVRDGKW